MQQAQLGSVGLVEMLSLDGAPEAVMRGECQKSIVAVVWTADCKFSIVTVGERSMTGSEDYQDTNPRYTDPESTVAQGQEGDMLKEPNEWAHGAFHSAPGSGPGINPSTPCPYGG